MSDLLLICTALATVVLSLVSFGGRTAQTAVSVVIFVITIAAALFLAFFRQHRFTMMVGLGLCLFAIAAFLTAGTLLDILKH